MEWEKHTHVHIRTHTHTGKMSSLRQFAVCAVIALVVAVCEGQNAADNGAVLEGLKAGRERWLNIQANYGLGDYQYRLYRPCLGECNNQFPDCFLGDHGPFYITVKDNQVTEALLLWNDTPLDSSRFQTLAQIFDDLEAQIAGGVHVDESWRFDDVQGVPDDVVIRPGGVPFATRIVVRLPVQFHMDKLNRARTLFRSAGFSNYSFTFQRLCFGCGPAETMVVRNGAAVDGGMTIEDVYDLMVGVIESDPLFLDIFYGNDGVPIGMDVDLFNAVVAGDTDDTIRISNFTVLDG